MQLPDVMERVRVRCSEAGGAKIVEHPGFFQLREYLVEYIYLSSDQVSNGVRSRDTRVSEGEKSIALQAASRASPRILGSRCNQIHLNWTMHQSISH